MPVTVNLTYRDGIYAFDSASSDLSEKNVLTWMVSRLLTSRCKLSKILFLVCRALCLKNSSLPPQRNSRGTYVKPRLLPTMR